MRKFDSVVTNVSESSAAFGHPLRIELYRYILKQNAELKPVRNKDIVDHFKYAQSTISGHLDKLAMGGLIKTKKDKTATLYYANVGFVSDFIAKLNALARIM
jgi:DNA-binding MarR family transcriptional regulator